MTIPAQPKRAAPPKRAVRDYGTRTVSPRDESRSVPTTLQKRAADTSIIDDAIANRKLVLTPITLRADEMEESEDRIIPVVFSAGAEYRQWWGREKLVVSKKAIKMERLNAQISPVLHNHNRDETIGVVDAARVEGEQAIADLRFSKRTHADEIYQDILEGIRRQISCGYRILKYEIDETNERDPLYTITEWEPYEISIVAYAADPDCQPINRSDILLPVEDDGTRTVSPRDESRSVPTTINESEEITTMDPKEALRIAKEAGIPELGTRAIEQDWSEETLRAVISTEQARSADDDSDDDDASADAPPAAAKRDDDAGDDDSDDDDAGSDDAEKARVTRIYDLGTEHGQRELALQAMVDPNCTPEEFASRLLALNKENKERAEAEQNRPERITLDPKDQANFRIVDLLYHLSSGRRSKRGGQEYEICEEETALRGKLGIETEGTPIPPQIFSDRSLYRNNSGLFLDKRILSAGVDTAGGHTIDDELLADGFIDILLEFHAALQMVTMLPDLMGNITFPRLNSRSVAYWTGETEAATETTAGFDTVTLTPKHLRAWSEISTTLLHQSSIPIEQFVRRDLARALAKEWDRAILFGTGASNQISGINAITNLQSVMWPADGTGGVSNFDYDSLLEVEETLGNEDALMGMLAWIVSPRIRRHGRETAELGSGTARPIWRMGRMLDYEAYVTTQVITYATDGSISDQDTGFFANWEEMMAGMWGGIDVLVNPYSKDKEGIVRITTGQMCDIAPRHDESFCKLSKTT